MTKSKLTVAVWAALVGACPMIHAAAAPQDAQNADQAQADTAADQKKAKKLEAVTVTGSLIPQTQIETAQPVYTITSEQMKQRGFATVAEALQQSSFATGSVLGAQSTNSITPAAQSLSMFGLPVGFTKYLIDGRPMGNFPGLYNGSQAFNNISGIPADMVDHIDILPGGQSSLYGSDAIAGVINIVLKKHVDAPIVDVRYGWYSDGGGADRRISFADSFNLGRWNSLVGVQFESIQPMWRSDRALTRQYYDKGTSPALASRDYLVVDNRSTDGTPKGYKLLDPNQCAGLAGQWHGTEGKQYRPGSGYYCGSLYTPGSGTLANGSKTANLYTHNTFDLSDNVQLYGDLLYNYKETKFVNGSGTTYWGSSVYDSNGGQYFWDPVYGGGSQMQLQHAFSPEEVGGYDHIMNKETENAYMLNLGVRGGFGQSSWEYDLGFTHSDDQLEDRNFVKLSGAMEQFFADHVMGPQLGMHGSFPIYQPNYAALYTPLTPEQFASFTTYATNRSKTWDNLLRGQLTNPSLFSLPGGDAGVAVVLEGGNEGWDSSPDPRYLQTTKLFNGATAPYFWGSSARPGAGHRSRYAATTELKFPLLQQLTLDVSGRYDSYHVGGKDVSHPTYNIGLEYRPFDSLLLRGRYGTAFKAPTLADEFQRSSTTYSSVYDYLNCARLGFQGANEVKCPAPYNSEQYVGTTYGNTALKPITAKVWSYGVVWAPLERMSVALDYLHWDIRNEVAQLTADQLSKTQYQCEIGSLDPSSGTCQQAFELAQRGPGTTSDSGVPLLGVINSVLRPKLNIAKESVNALSASFNYVQDIGYLGRLSFAASYSDLLKHTYKPYANDPEIDLLTNPGESSDFKSKANASVTWSKDRWSTTLYVNRYGSAPNYAAEVANNYTSDGAAKLPPWILWNASVTYNPMKNLGLSLLVNNLFNKMPPVDHTYPGTSSMPYDPTNYNVYGRAIYLEANYKFGKDG